MTYRNIEVAAFDWDGTVIDSVPYKLAQNQELARRFNRNMSLDEVRGVWNGSQGFYDLMEQLTGLSDEAEINAAVSVGYSKPEFAKRLFGFSKNIPPRVRKLGIGAALVTSVARPILTIDATDLGFSPIENHFDFIQAADEWTYKKPDPRVFDKMIGFFGVKSANILYFGDELKDYAAADDAGMQFIGVETGLATRQDFQDAGAFSVPTLDDALTILEVSLGDR